MDDAGFRGPLPPPPRPVPLGLRCELIAGPLTLFGALFFLIGGSIAPVFAFATESWQPLWLRLGRREASGWIETVERTHFSEGGSETTEGTPIFRWRFAFQLPDGAVRRGASYSVGQRLRSTSGASGASRRTAVVVEYSPARPEVCRIRGTRFRPYPPWGLFVLVFPLLGLALAAGGAAAGRRRVRLLRDGQEGRATLLAWRFSGGESAGQWVPLEELRRRLEVADALAAGVPPAAVRRFFGCWTAAVVGIGAWGGLFLLVVLASALTGFPLPLQLSPGERWIAAGAVVIFGLFWFGILTLMLHGSGEMRRLQGEGKPAALGACVAECRFEITLPDGRTVEAVDRVRLTPRIGDQPDEPVLYDPQRPEQAILLDGPALPLRVGVDGRWEAPRGPGPYLRTLLVVLGFVLPIAGWSAYLLLRPA